MDLEIAQSNCSASYNWCIRNRLERHRKVVSRDWRHMQIRSIAESALILGTAKILRSRSHTDALLNEDNYNNNTEGAHLAEGRLMTS